LIKISVLKKNIQKFILIACTLFCCTACFDIQENFFLKKDGSGTFSFVIDMSQFKSMMAMFDGIGSAFEDKDKRNEKAKKEKKKSPNEKLSSTFEKTRRKLLNTGGISNVKSIEDTTNLIVGISFDFKNIIALNDAMNKLFEGDSVNSDTSKVTYFEYKNKQLTRLEVLDSKSILGKTNAMSAQKDDNAESMPFDVEKLFGDVTYSTNYEFEDKIDAVQNENALLSTNMQKVTLKIYPFVTPKDSTQKKHSIGNSISFK
jgi:hypothetical protein